jgi:hypothetical protein
MILFLFFFYDRVIMFYDIEEPGRERERTDRWRASEWWSRVRPEASGEDRTLRLFEEQNERIAGIKPGKGTDVCDPFTADEQCNGEDLAQKLKALYDMISSSVIIKLSKSTDSIYSLFVSLVYCD